MVLFEIKTFLTEFFQLGIDQYVKLTLTNIFGPGPNLPGFRGTQYALIDLRSRENSRVKSFFHMFCRANKIQHITHGLNADQFRPTQFFVSQHVSKSLTVIPFRSGTEMPALNALVCFSWSLYPDIQITAVRYLVKLWTLNANSFYLFIFWKFIYSAYTSSRRYIELHTMKICILYAGTTHPGYRWFPIPSS